MMMMMVFIIIIIIIKKSIHDLGFCIVLNVPICLNSPLQFHNVYSYFHMSSVAVQQTRRLSTFSFAQSPVCVHPHSKTGTLIHNTKKKIKEN